MARSPDKGNNFYRSYNKDSVYIYNNNEFYNVDKIHEHIKNQTLNYSPCSGFPIHEALSCCNIEHEFNWEAILPIVKAARDARSACGANVKLVFPDWLTPPLIVVFPNEDWRVVSGQDRLQVMRLLEETRIDVNIIRNVDMEHYQIDLSPVVPEHLKSYPRMQILTRPVPLQNRAFAKPGNSANTGKLSVAHAIQLLKAQVMFEASGDLIAQARTELEKRNLAPNSWGSFDNLVKTLPPHVVGLSKPKKIKDAFLSDPEMDRRKNPTAWSNKLKWLGRDILWLAAAHRQSQVMEKAYHYMEEELEYGPEYESREEFLTKAALAPPKNRLGEEISLLGLTRIAMLSAVNPADLWLSWAPKRHELEFAAVMGCLSNLQPALLTPATAQAAVDIAKRARAAPNSCTEEQFVAALLIDCLEKTCNVAEFMAAARIAIRDREPVRISLATTILPSGLVMEPLSELLCRAMRSNAAAAAP